MASDRSLAIRRAILTALKADAPLLGLIPASSMHPQAPASEPSWPFIKTGAPSGLPINAACVDGSVTVVAVHGFAKPRIEDGAVVESAEDHAARIGAFTATALDKKKLALDGGGEAKLRWTGSQLLQDRDEADAFHTVQNFSVRSLG